MKLNQLGSIVLLVSTCILAGATYADCVVPEQSKQLDPVEVGYCESDAVFVAESEGGTESFGGVTDEATGETKHTGIRRNTLRIIDSHKGALPIKVTMIVDLYAKDRAYEFEFGKKYLVFARKLPGENEYAGATAKCSVQPTLLIATARDVLKQLEQHRKGVKKIDCAKIRPKAKS